MNAQDHLLWEVFEGQILFIWKGVYFLALLEWIQSGKWAWEHRLKYENAESKRQIMEPQARAHTNCLIFSFPPAILLEETITETNTISHFSILLALQ